jgi:hypothetical protein
VAAGPYDWVLEPIAFIENKGGNRGEGNRDPNHRKKSKWMISKRECDVHSVKSRHKGWQIENDCEGGENLHDTIQVVGDDRSKGIHHAGKDLRIDVGHLNGLLVLGQYIFEQVLIIFIIVEDLRALDTLHHHFIRAQRGGEIGQTLLILEQLQYLAVARGLLQLILDPLGDPVDLAQIPKRYTVQSDSACWS